MKEKGVDQRCTTIKVLGNGNWEEYMWPHQIDKTVEPVDKKKTKQPAVTTQNINTVEKGATQFINAFGNTSITGGVNVHYK